MNSSQASEVQAIFVSNYVHLFSIVILYYDHILTFPDEYQYLWRPRKNFSAICFFLNRYIAVLGNTSVLVSSFHPFFSSEACRRYQLWRQIMLFWNQILCIILLTLRVYALYERSRKILVFLGCLGMGLLGLSCWALTGEHASAGHTELGCHLANPKPTVAHIALPWQALFAYDLSVVVLIFYKTLKTYSKLTLRQRPSLITVVLFDGLIYFIVMSLTNMGNALTYYIAEEAFLRGCLTTFSACISVTLVSRLMLNLHKSNSTGILSTFETSPSFAFNRMSQVERTGFELDSIYTASELQEGVDVDDSDLYDSQSSFAHSRQPRSGTPSV